AYPSSEVPALPPARDAPAAACRDAGCHEPTVTVPSREEVLDELPPRPRTRHATALDSAGASCGRHNRYGGRRPAGGGMRGQPVIHRSGRLTECGRVSELYVSGRLHQLHALP